MFSSCVTKSFKKKREAWLSLSNGYSMISIKLRTHTICCLLCFLKFSFYEFYFVFNLFQLLTYLAEPVRLPDDYTARYDYRWDRWINGEGVRFVVHDGSFKQNYERQENIYQLFSHLSSRN